MEARIAWLKERFEAVSGDLVATLAARGIAPAQVSLSGVAVCVVAALLIAAGWLTSGAVLFALGSLADAIDGALARRLGVTSDAGALLDSTLDRIGEAAGLAGLAAYFASRGQVWPVVLCVAALLGGNLTSYIRARSESLGLECTDGWVTRTERVFIFCLGLALHLPALTVAVLAIATNATAAQRFVHVRRALTSRGRE